MPAMSVTTALVTGGALVVMLASPISAKVLAEGRPVQGLYWQKIEQKSGKVVYLCRSISEGKIQKTARCQSAGAVKPG
jgi:hypothetical protein